jgi:hypothetical protein
MLPGVWTRPDRPGSLAARGPRWLALANRIANREARFNMRGAATALLHYGSLQGNREARRDCPRTTVLKTRRADLQHRSP